MGKLSTARLFDVALVAKEKAYKELEPFVEWVQNSVDMLYRTVNGNITLAENIAGQSFTWTVRSSTTTVTDTIRLGTVPKHAWVSRQSPISPAITSFVWSPSKAGTGIDVTITFAQAPTAGVAVTVLALNG